ncbi:MAG: tetratricopeptide repeat protein, partial [Desulfovibrio sp.]|nr:tetratricopeptide repeat protein [Desulfovibrio sp.]
RAKLPAKARFETEVLILEVAADISRQPLVRTFFDKIAGAGQAGVSYRPGEEEKFLKTMRILLKGLKNMEEEKRRRERQTLDNRRESLQEKGLAYLKAGDAPRGKSALRVLADEFGHEPGVLASIGGWLQEAGLFLDAVEFLEQAIRDFPKDSSAYGHAAAVYSSLSEFEKAEAVYLKALKEFGKHPRTMLNLAKLYLNWNKKDKAYDAAREACRGDPSLDEARAIMASCS